MKTLPGGEIFFSAREVAAYIGVSRVTMYKYINSGKLKGVPFGGGMHILKRNLEAFLGTDVDAALVKKALEELADEADE